MTEPVISKCHGIMFSCAKLAVDTYALSWTQLVAIVAVPKQ